jgi:hypothetical protein
MALQQEVKDEVLRQLQDGDWHTPDEVWRHAVRQLIFNPDYADMLMQDLRIETYAAVRQVLIDLALKERIEVTKDGHIRIKPER